MNRLFLRAPVGANWLVEADGAFRLNRGARLLSEADEQQISAVPQFSARDKNYTMIKRGRSYLGIQLSRYLRVASGSVVGFLTQPSRLEILYRGEMK